MLMLMLMLMLIYQMTLQHPLDAVLCYAKQIAYTNLIRSRLCSLMARTLFGCYDRDASRSES